MGLSGYKKSPPGLYGVSTACGGLFGRNRECRGRHWAMRNSTLWDPSNSAGPKLKNNLRPASRQKSGKSPVDTVWILSKYTLKGHTQQGSFSPRKFLIYWGDFGYPPSKLNLGYIISYLPLHGKYILKYFFAMVGATAPASCRWQARRSGTFCRQLGRLPGTPFRR